MAVFSDTEISQALAGLPGWAYEGGEVTREFRFRDFVEAFGFMAQIAAIQEQMNHHATLTNTWANVTVSVSTHSEGGITEKDIELARRISERAGNGQ